MAATKWARGSGCDGRAFFSAGGPNNAVLHSFRHKRTLGSWQADPVIPNGMGGSRCARGHEVNGKILCALTPTSGIPTELLLNMNPVANSFTQVNGPGSA